MTKYYCDCCGDEITAENDCTGGRVNCPDSQLGTEVESKRTGVILRVEIITTMNDRWNQGNFCVCCVLDALYQLDPRKQRQKKKTQPIKI